VTYEKRSCSQQICKEFEEELTKRGITFIAIKRKNMVKSEEEKKYYVKLSKINKSYK